ncbi:protein-glutamate methylesterase/protein-glutamine glutaminase [Zhongshania aliphaticivorans]|uniref:protein-glutamate methylesterase/protein-glutamine glutaminase n=1 Tax=Zhongshania aliphaticivorans TaxID=1470434 RepID=UPI0012E47915|nr:chemotaxis response regulator protein-glutamate methylesterase [Zhongshania aliphaticivorans]CAA0107822.1 Chemotaxis response regulator protein-glutamate methylesterase [Zhongshania aliphaticivorans]
MMIENNIIRVVVVDDSALMRRVLSDILNSDTNIKVVATARDPFDAREKIKLHNPDVITLDVEMPRMDGLQFLKNLMRLRPMPVVMVSSLTTRHASVTLEAIQMGAFDFVAKPEIDIARGLADSGRDIIEKVKAAAQANVTHLATLAQARIPLATPKISSYRTTDQLIAIGASTGGTEAIRVVLQGMPADSPGIVIVQHIPGMFSSSFAERLNSLCGVTVKEAEDGDRILSGHAYIAPGEKHLSVVRDGAQYRCRVSDEDPVNRHRPSVDVLFHSVAKAAGRNATGVILTGMGKDGAIGMKAMHDKGAYTIAQSERSSVVWGMPGSAVRLEAVDRVVELVDIAELLANSTAHA